MYLLNPDLLCTGSIGDISMSEKGDLFERETDTSINSD